MWNLTRTETHPQYLEASCQPLCQLFIWTFPECWCFYPTSVTWCDWDGHQQMDGVRSSVSECLPWRCIFSAAHGSQGTGSTWTLASHTAAYIRGPLKHLHCWWVISQRVQNHRFQIQSSFSVNEFTGTALCPNSSQLFFKMFMAKSWPAYWQPSCQSSGDPQIQVQQLNGGKSQTQG